MSDARSPRTTQPSLFDAPAGTAPAAAPPGPPPPDRTAVVPAAPADADADAEARVYAVDPRNNVVLEASAGTGKTSVLVSRYVNLLKAGVDPANILAITFTRKAAAEMRERIIRELRSAAERSQFDRARWLELRDRLGEIGISTIDAFCLSLLHEFPLEADVDPAFDLADETEVPRLISVALDRALRILVGLARTDTDIALVLAQLGIARTRDGLATLLDRRLVAWDALDRFLARGPRDLNAPAICRAAAITLADTLSAVPGGFDAFLADGPTAHPRYGLFRRDAERLGRIAGGGGENEAAIRSVLDRVSGHFLTNDGTARKGTSIYPYNQTHYPTREAMRRHRDAVFGIAPRVEAVMFAFNRDLNVVLARGVRRMFGVALEQYRTALEERALLDFSDVLEKALQLLRQMDEFSQSRFRLESRFQHVLVDEFQDTSRAQWQLVSLLVQAWGEGLGVATNPSIFIVGDRKQSIYRFRDADVSVLEQAAGYIQGLRPGGRARRSIARSFRAVPELLHFVNDVFAEMSQPPATPGAFTYNERDRFPVSPESEAAAAQGPVLGVAVAETPDECAAAVAAEIASILGSPGATVRDKTTGLARPARAGDIGILFRSRSTHREFERELNLRGIPTYVYKGLGFFDADEIKDVVSLLRYLADPSSDLRTAAFLRSRFIRLSDAALTRLSPRLSSALIGESFLNDHLLHEEDREVLAHARPAVRRWLDRVDRITPAELLDEVLSETGYAYELGGARRRQAWENLKKLRSLVRRIQNRGYATIPRIAEHLDTLSAGDESNAVVEALDSVNLMTVHASKGLEFPIVFVVNLAKGASGPPRPVRVAVDADEPSVSVGPFISEMDEAEKEHERHETRRLLYVALTRARDRLYLSASLKDGALVPGRGSLAEVLPESLRQFLNGAASVFDEVDTIAWTGASGHVYSWQVCRAAAAATATTVLSMVATQEAHADDFAAPPGGGERLRVPTRDWIAGSGKPVPGHTAGSTSDRLLGIVIHRLFEHAGAQMDPTAVRELCHRLLRDEERLTVDSPEMLREKAIEVWSRAHGRPDVAMALSGAERIFEVPFALALEDGRSIVRGTIDCLVRKKDGAILVVEFKTGRPQPEHQRQLDLYVQAAALLHADAPQVSGVLLYL